jgi:WD40 repeat protein
MLRRWLLALSVGVAVLGITACNGTGTPKNTGPAGTEEETYKPYTDVGEYLYTPENPPVKEAQATEGQKLIDPVVIPDCRLNVFEKQDVPAQKDGVVVVLGTDATPEELQKLNENQKVAVTINGEKKIFRRLDRGDFVKEDQLIGIVFDEMARDDVAIKLAKHKVAEADREAAYKTKDEAMARYRTQEILFGTGTAKMPATSKEDLRAALLLAQTKYYEWVSKSEAVTQAAAELKQAKTTLAMYEVRSKIPGQITEVFKRQGESVKALEPVVQVHNQNKVRVEGFMDLQYTSKLLDGLEPRKGMKVVVEASVPQAQRKPLTGHLQEVTGIAVGKTRTKTVVVSASLDRTVVVWDPATGKADHVVRLEPVVGRAYVACTGPKAKDNLMACGGQDGNVTLWDLDSNMAGPVRELKDGHQGPISCVAFSPDGLTCATGGEDRRICLWNTATGELRYKIPGAHNGMITSLQFTPQCKLVTAGKDNRMQAWSLGKDRYVLEKCSRATRSGDVATLGVSPDGRRVLFDHGKALQVLSVPEGRYEGRLQHSSGTAGFTTFALFSPDANFILTAGGAEGNVQLWRAPTATSQRGYEFRQLLPRAQGRAPVTGAAFAPDNSFLVTSYRNGEIFVWDVPQQKELDQTITAKVALVGYTVETNSQGGQVRIVADLTEQNKPLRPGTTATLVIDPSE